MNDARRAEVARYLREILEQARANETADRLGAQLTLIHIADLAEKAIASLSPDRPAT